MDDIVARLRDLKKQATAERSHYYVAKTAQDAVDEIERLRKCGTCGKPLGRDCPTCKRLWES